MSDHTVEELERQVQQAESLFDDAGRAFIAAQKRLHEKRCADSGLIGKVASYRGRFLLIKDIHFQKIGQKLEIYQYFGPRILKGGALGEQIKFYAFFDDVQISDAFFDASKAPSEPHQEHRKANDA